MSSSICTIDGCDNQAQKLGLCRRHFKDKYGMTLDTYNANKVKEIAEQEAPYADPMTGMAMGNLKRVSEVYRYELDALSATVTISDGKLAGIKVRWENGEEWSIKDTDMPFLSGLVKEVEGLCRI